LNQNRDQRASERVDLGLVGDGEVLAGLLLVLAADKVCNHLVLVLLSGALVVLGTLLEDVLLDPVDTYRLRDGFV